MTALPPPFFDRSALAGKVVLVTGSSQGLGLVMATALGRAGAKLILHGRTLEGAERARQTLAAEGIAAVALAADLSAPESCEPLIAEAVAAFGGLDILVNNAGVAGPAPAPLWEQDAGDWAETLGINLTAPALCAAAFIRLALARGGGGRIVNILSAAAHTPFAGIAPYCSAKAGLAMLTRGLAAELHGTAIAVVGLEPSSHATRMTAERLPAETLARLEPPEALEPLFLWAVTAPPGRVHGRIFSESRFRRDPEAEALLAGPAALARRFSPFMPRLSDTSGGRHLDFLENPCGPPPAAVKAARRAAASLATYPDPGARTLRGALSDRLGLPGSAISFGSGSAEVVARLVRTFVKPGEAVLTTDPTWPMLERICEAEGVELRSVPYALDRSGPRAVVGAGRLLGAVDASVRLVYLANPNFPLASWLDEADLRLLLAGLGGAVPLVVDEAYVDFAEPQRQALVPELANEGHAILGVRTFSKFHGLAGLRLGYAFGHPALIDAAARLETGFTVSAITEAAAVAALGDRAHAARTGNHLARAAKAMTLGLRRLGLTWLESDVNFRMAEAPAAPDRVFDALHEAGLHVPEVEWNGFVMLPVATAADSRRIIDVFASLA